MTNDVRASRVMKQDMDDLKAWITSCEQMTIDEGEEWDASEIAYTVLWWLTDHGYDVTKTSWVRSWCPFKSPRKGPWIVLFRVDDQAMSLGAKVSLPDFEKTLAFSLRLGRHVLCSGVTL